MPLSLIKHIYNDFLLSFGSVNYILNNHPMKFAEELERVLQQWKIRSHGGVEYFPALYGDDIYEVCNTIVKRLRGVEIPFHGRMGAGRIDVEHEFGLNALLWKRLSTKHTWKILSLRRGGIITSVFSS